MRLPRVCLSLLATALSIAAITVLLPCLAHSDSPPKAVEPAVVPFKMLPSNHMVVEAKINGKGPFRLIFDLGSPVTLVGNKAAERSGVIEANAPKSLLFGTRGEGKVKTLEMGGLKAQDIPVVVLDHPVLKALGGFLGRPLDGIMGYTFFARYKTTIDYKAGEMTFSPVEFQVRDLVKDLQSQMTAPKVARLRVLASKGLWGLSVGKPAGGVSSPGVPVTAVLAGSPSAEAGLKPGDILTTLDGRWTTSVADVYGAASGVPAGQPALVTLLRDGQEVTVTVTPKDGL